MTTTIDDDGLRAIESQICGDAVNGGLIRDIAFTVWSICHNPTHEDGNSDWSSDTLPSVNAVNEKVRGLLAALRSSPAVDGVGVKPIEWHQTAGNAWQANTLIGRYTVVGRSWWGPEPTNDFQEAATVAKAKAAAQADYVRRIRSALSPTSSLPQDVIDLVIEARNVAYSDQSPEAIRALDKAVEAFAERVRWDDEPEDDAALSSRSS